MENEKIRSQHKFDFVAFVACEAYIIDQRSLISLINIFQQIKMQESPFHYIFWFYLSIIPQDNFEHQIKVTFKESPSSLEKDVFEYRFSNSSKLLQHYLQRVEANFKSYEDCFLFGYLDGELIGEIRLGVIP